MKAHIKKMTRGGFGSTVLSMLFCCGCLTGHFVSRPNNIHIAYGNRLPDCVLPFGGSNLVAYQIEKIVSGHFLTNDIVYVQFFPSSLPQNGLCSNAILVLNFASYMFDDYDEAYAFVSQDGKMSDPFAARKYDALGGDAYRGFLPNTVENRKWVESGGMAYSGGNPRKKQLSKKGAIEKALCYCRAKNKESKSCLSAVAKRYSYGWDVSVSEGDLVGNDCLITIGDDGVVKAFIPGR